MRAESLLLVAVASTLLAPSRPAAACGPDFAIELLADRGAVIAELPEGIFADEAAALVAPNPAYLARADDDAPLPAPSWVEAVFYARAAAAFHAGDREAAARGFEAVLALPPPLRRALSTSAAYSLSRVNLHGGGVAACRRVRALVDAGFVDPDGLAAASLWREAMLTDDAIAEVRLFAQRAALGHADAAHRLLSIAEDAIADGRERALLREPIGQRLIAAYLYARDGELSDGDRARVWREIAALPSPSGADRLAAAAYRKGDWAMATRLSARAADSPVNRWVRAKLAARAGDAVAASALVCSAADAMPATTACPDFLCGEYLARDRARGECALLRLSADEPVAAMQAAWQARGHYRDEVYIAERVLTLDELAAFATSLGTCADDDYACHDLRNLYGRRLMRAGRFDDALPWLAPEHVAAASAYARAIRAARVELRPIVRAAALFAASRIARDAGIDLLGTDHAPDWADAVSDLSSFSAGGNDDDGAWITAREAARVEASAPANGTRYHYRLIASHLAEAAAELLPRTSQAFAATLCWGGLDVRNLDEERRQQLYQRYLDEGPPVAGMDFGTRCPAPAFERATRVSYRARLDRAHHPRWQRRLAAQLRRLRRAAPPWTLLALLALAIVRVRRGPRRPAMRP